MSDTPLIHDKLEKARRDLLDLTARNRLIHTARTSSRGGRLEIVDELSDEIFRILVKDGKPMTFLHGRGTESEESEQDDLFHLAQPADEEDEDGVAARHVDLHLQTRLTSEGLQRRLLKLFYDARTFEEEQGVNILYLALGYLKWFEDDKSDRERFAPLLLIPVELERRSASSRFRLRYSENDITTNLSLQEKLKAEFGIRLPDVPDLDDLVPSDYFDQVSAAIAEKPRWEVLPNDIVLWFFSFAKFLMYRDLQPESWPDGRSIDQMDSIQSLLGRGFDHSTPFCEEMSNIDELLHPLDLIHVMDADGSQTMAIEEVKRGKNLIIQGPPGTGKSQTITNLIATAVKEGKKVLFVAEKMAALDVVKRRLDSVGLGDMCLELHSHKANKRDVLNELSRTLSLGKPITDDFESHAADLKSHRDRLNRHAAAMHTQVEPSHITPYQALGRLVQLRAKGVKPADFSLESPLTWTSADIQAKRNRLAELAVHMQEVGDPRIHPWRGVEMEVALPTDIDRLTDELRSISERCERLSMAASELAGKLGQPRPETFASVSSLAMLGQRLVQAPQMDRDAMGNDAWKNNHDEIVELVSACQQIAGLKEQLDNVVAEAAWTTPVSAARRDLAAYGRSLLRIFNGRYRAAQATLRGILMGVAPKDLDERLRILDSLMVAQKTYKLIEKDESEAQIGKNAFGTLWKGERSDASRLREIIQWEADCRNAKLPDDFRRIFGAVESIEEVKQLIQSIAKDLKPLVKDLQEVFDRLKIDLRTAFDVAALRDLPLPILQQRLDLWTSQPEQITKWIAYFIRRRQLDSEGMGALGARIDEGAITGDEVVERFHMAFYEEVMREAFRRNPELAVFDGGSHEKSLEAFRQLDLQRISLARQEVALSHFQSLPLGGEAGEPGIVRREIKKKRKHMPLRKLLQEAGHAVQAIKPVMMMSPISVAQYLQPGVLEFDLLLIDEASQVRPVDALGAIARARQVVVVGDDRQLPPTRFFSKVVGDDGESTDAADFQAADMESILGLCEAQNMPQRMLRWHYRSRHHSLIAVSNQEFYESNLFVVPSPFNRTESLGLKFHLVPNGCFDRGGSATNRNEAIAVAEAVMQHARNTPDKTLGVGAFSVSQRDAILDELELRRRESPETESFFGEGTAEPFFVKNLENLQGDERDVIFISVGYGRDASGYMAMSFGPLNNDGGERRLNVLISRAKERCEVFSSITADDIDLNRTQARGVRALKSFLSYARTGVLGVAAPTGRGFDSDFEREVANELIQRGYEIECQVGVAGFFIDLAVVDPESPGRYLIGIECDGAAYHSSRSARDRDRLRQQVLEDRGWLIHRIWSTDWFHRPEEQLNKVIAAIENAKVTWEARFAQTHDQQPPASTEPTLPIDRQETVFDEECGMDSIETSPYVEADLTINTTHAIHELPPEQLARVVSAIVKIEGPIHQDEITRRVASSWGLKRAGRRIAECVDAALTDACFRGVLQQYGLFFTISGQDSFPIRDRANVQASCLRKPEYLPPSEIRDAVIAVVTKHLGVTKSDAAPEVAKLFGFRNTSAQLREVIEDEIRYLINEKEIEERNERLYRDDVMAGSLA